MVELFQSKGERHGRKAQDGTQGVDGNGLESGPVWSESFWRSGQSVFLDGSADCMAGTRRNARLLHEGQCVPDVDGDRAETGESETGADDAPRACIKEWGGNATYRPDTKRSQVLHVRIEFGSCSSKSQ